LGIKGCDLAGTHTGTAAKGHVFLRMCHARILNLTLGVSVQNLFNNSDLATPQGTLSSGLFGQSTQLTGAPYTVDSAVRRITLQTSFTF